MSRPLRRPSLALHGGAGTLPRKRMTPEREREYRVALAGALEAGWKILAAGGPGLDAVVAAVAAMEDSPLFNAGRGAVYNADGRHELDAGVMDGASRRAGAVAAVGRIRNPVFAARAVMERTRHVLLAGAGAERFARDAGLPLVRPSYFHTPERLEALQRNLRSHHGTVGAVACDAQGKLAAATSTGGFTAKMAGRIGDTPIVGAGVYADELCAVSGTGLGEAFIRAVVGHDVSARMRYGGESLGRAAAAALRNVARLGGDGGLVAVDRHGNVSLPFNSDGMYRAWVDVNRRARTAIY